ncbi:lipopolysaccharide biosynthesis protein [Bifidobacterium pseudolongum]|uniref:lipopolysaccharide biosynthesis protein n=1 Tax=Bifidobacterium pseudolongum TaxID=1694 RepID=UPI0010221511|nr:oligosaccharide flippase family protein [Bifidobacterium pseudolongum]RYQ54709.1 multidrug transporter [Bifidobacterium pseudolongum subsp. globosum]RYQ77415.1 multidrug transporter [Bifidobacterium pseudolongum subsp. globosum]
MGKYKNLLVNIGLFGLNTVATKLITFLLVPLYTWYMSATEFGITDMSVIVINLVMPLATLSIADATLRYALDDVDRDKQYITIGLLVVTLSCIIVLCCLPCLKMGVFGGLGSYSWLFLLSYAANAYQMFFNNVARAVNEVKIIPIASAVTALSTGVLAYAFIGLMHSNIYGYFWSLIIGNALGCLFYLLGGHLVRYLATVTLHECVQCLRPMLRYSLPLIPNALFWWVGTSINRFFITSMLGIAYSGLFAAASKIPSLLNIICGVFQQAWTLSAFQEYRRTNISGFFTKIFRVFQCGMVLSSAVIILLAPWFSRVMLQKEFYDSWVLVPTLIVAFYFNTMNAFFGTVYTASMKTQTLFTTTVVGSVVIVAATYLLLPVMGLQGACIAMVLSNFVVLVLRMWFSRRYIIVHVHWCTVLPSLIMLITQAVIMVNHIPNYKMWSFMIFTSICLIQIIDLSPVVKELLLSNAIKNSEKCK